MMSAVPPLIAILRRNALAFAGCLPISVVASLLASYTASDHVASKSEPTVPLDTFVVGLRTAWQDGEVRPTSQAKPKAKRGRRRPDPLIAVTDDLHSWFDADPSLSGALALRAVAIATALPCGSSRSPTSP